MDWANVVSGTQSSYIGLDWRYCGEPVTNISIASDKNGDMYVAGSFVGTFDFDTSLAEYNLISQPFGVFITKYSNKGNLVWGRALTSNYGRVYDCKIAAKDGNTYVCGIFSGQIDFDGQCILTSNRDGMFVAEFDQMGQFIWARVIPGSLQNLGNGNFTSGMIVDSQISLDNTGNIYLTGIFRGIIDFDPTEEQCNLKSDGQGMFITKYDNAGNFLWAKAVNGWYQIIDYGSISNEIINSKIALDVESNVYLAGDFYGTIDFDPGQDQCILSSSNGIFFTKYDKTGKFLWAHAITRKTEEVYNSWIGDGRIAVDNSCNVYLSGIFGGVIDVDPGVGVYELKSSNGSSMFFAKYDNLGNFQWAHSIKGEPVGDIFNTQILLDNSSNIYLNGIFSGTLDFDTGTGNCMFTSDNAIGLFITKYDTKGKFIWGEAVQGSDYGFLERNDIVCSRIAIDQQRNLYLAGIFGGKLDFDFSDETHYLNSKWRSMFLAKYKANNHCHSCITESLGTIEVQGSFGAKVSLNGSCSSDEDSSPGTNDDINDFNWYRFTAQDSNKIFLGSGEILDCNLPLGEHKIILEVIDKAGASDSNEITITVQDTTSPNFRSFVSPKILWPANHKMVKVTPFWLVKDICDPKPKVSLVNITSNDEA